jgi:hypothetical protein
MNHKCLKYLKQLSKKKAGGIILSDFKLSFKTIKRPYGTIIKSDTKKNGTEWRAQK